jgi:hypothetical protein
MRNRLHLSFSSEIYEHTRKLDMQPALLSTRRSRDIPIFCKNISEKGLEQSRKLRLSANRDRNPYKHQAGLLHVSTNQHP